MSLHLEDPLIGDFEVLPPLSVEATPQSVSGYGIRGNHAGLCSLGGHSAQPEYR